MAFADRLAEPEGPPPPKFLVDAHLAKMPDKEREAALAYLHSGHTSAAVARGFRAEGYQVGESAVRSWRRANQANP